jgi:hypothetical protein
LERIGAEWRGKERFFCKLVGTRFKMDRRGLDRRGMERSGPERIGEERKGEVFL